jgi:hypothetical protein
MRRMISHDTEVTKVTPSDGWCSEAPANGHGMRPRAAATLCSCHGQIFPLTGLWFIACAPDKRTAALLAQQGCLPPSSIPQGLMKGAQPSV